MNIAISTQHPRQKNKLFSPHEDAKLHARISSSVNQKRVKFLILKRYIIAVSCPVQNNISMSRQLHFTENSHFRVLRLLEANPKLSQRELAQALGISLGKTNYCIRALLDKGMLKVQNFQSSKRKIAYAYCLTPAGIAEKTALTGRFLQRKLHEYDLLKSEIESLQLEISLAT